LSRRAGTAAERYAEHYLLQKGLKLVARNFHSRFGEIDLVMEDRDTLVFVEVRSRSAATFCSAAESVGARKQSRIIRAAQCLIAYRPKLAERPMRFDVVAISRVPGHNAIEWIRDAFRP
jgi:putative endonuclease